MYAKYAYLSMFLATIIPMEKTQHLLKYTKDVQQRKEQHKKTLQDQRLASLNFSGTYQGEPTGQLAQWQSIRFEIRRS